MSCPFYTFKNGFLSGDYWCNVTNQSVNDDIYYRYCRNYDYDICPVYKKQNNSSSTCYLTTIVCSILGKKDDDQVLNTMRSFRDNVMQKQEEYFDKLLDYDNVGPILSYKLFTDKDNKVISELLYEDVLTPISQDINKKEYDKAVEKYEIMTLSLINYYRLKHWFNNSKDENYGITEFNKEMLGHGVRTRKGE